MDEVHGGKMFWRELSSRFQGVQTRILGPRHGKTMEALPPPPQPGTMSLDPISLAQRMLDTIQPGQLRNKKVGSICNYPDIVRGIGANLTVGGG